MPGRNRVISWAKLLDYGELLSAVKYGMNITHLPLYNGQPGKISKGRRSGIWDVWPTSLHNPNFAEYAKLCGALGIRAGNRETLDAALNTVLATMVPAWLRSSPAPNLCGNAPPEESHEYQGNESRHLEPTR